MWQGRYVLLCALALLSGNFLGNAVPLSPAIYILLSIISSAFCLWFKRMPLLLSTLALLGAASVQIDRMPCSWQNQESPLKIRASSIKEECSDYFSTILPEGDELGVMKAIGIGDRSGLSYDLKEAYRQSGAMHLLALSGLHVGIIYALLSLLFKPLGGYTAARILRSLLSLSAIWLYAVISGLSPSIFRAVIMITVYELSTFISGDRDGLAAMSASAIVIMVLRPESPRDIGFQLSYSAVFAIFVIYPRLRLLIHSGSRILTRIWELLCVSLACQSTCGILAWIYFGTFPKYFLLTALMAVPLASIVLYCIAGGTAIFLLAGNSPLIQEAVSESIGFIIRLLNTVVATIAGLS